MLELEKKKDISYVEGSMAYIVKLENSNVLSEKKNPLKTKKCKRDIHTLSAPNGWIHCLLN